jgi:hypothetical protein
MVLRMGGVFEVWVDWDRRVLTVPRSKHGEKRRVYHMHPRHHEATGERVAQVVPVEVGDPLNPYGSGVNGAQDHSSHDAIREPSSGTSIGSGPASMQYWLSTEQGN